MSMFIAAKDTALLTLIEKKTAHSIPVRHREVCGFMADRGIEQITALNLQRHPEIVTSSSCHGSRNHSKGAQALRGIKFEFRRVLWQEQSDQVQPTDTRILQV